MYKLIAVLSAICFAYSVYGLVDLGTAWIYQGFGLNPYLAFPAALACLIATVGLAVHILRLLDTSTS